MLKPYKTIIERWLWPDVYKNQEYSVSKAKKPITDYKKASGLPEGVAELTVYYCERAIEQRGSILEFEDQNFALDASRRKQLEPLYCAAISAKRYAMFNIDSAGEPIIRKASAHGLGHLLPPYSDEAKDERDSRAGLAPAGKRRLFTAHVASGHSLKPPE